MSLKEIMAVQRRHERTMRFVLDLVFAHESSIPQTFIESLAKYNKEIHEEFMKNLSDMSEQTK